MLSASRWTVTETGLVLTDLCHGSALFFTLRQRWTFFYVLKGYGEVLLMTTNGLVILLKFRCQWNGLIHRP